LTRSKVSKRYAKALLSLGMEDGRYQDYGKELRAFADLYESYGELNQAITNPAFTLEDRKQILKALLARSPVSDTTRNFLNLLLDKSRISAVGAISGFYEQLTDEVSNIVRAEVLVSRALAGEAESKLGRALEQMTKKKVRMNVRQDKSIVGGIIVKIGDLVVDGSVRAQVQGIKESLKRGE
jgi:F-type H+-transporting ATPase subunit delta